jgi:hypothetical protein
MGLGEGEGLRLFDVLRGVVLGEAAEAEAGWTVMCPLLWCSAGTAGGRWSVNNEGADRACKIDIRGAGSITYSVSRRAGGREERGSTDIIEIPMGGKLE